MTWSTSTTTTVSSESKDDTSSDKASNISDISESNEATPSSYFISDTTHSVDSTTLTTPELLKTPTNTEPSVTVENLSVSNESTSSENALTLSTSGIFKESPGLEVSTHEVTATADSIIETSTLSSKINSPKLENGSVDNNDSNDETIGIPASIVQSTPYPTVASSPTTTTTSDASVVPIKESSDPNDVLLDKNVSDISNSTETLSNLPSSETHPKVQTIIAPSADTDTESNSPRLGEQGVLLASSESPISTTEIPATSTLSTSFGTTESHQLSSFAPLTTSIQAVTTIAPTTTCTPSTTRPIHSTTLQSSLASFKKSASICNCHCNC